MSENNQTQSKGRGGARKGAGRKEGSATKKTREIADQAAEAGITPLQVMLKAMMALYEKAETLADDDVGKLDGRDVSRLGLLVAASDVAKDAAPYIHPRLAAIEHSGRLTVRTLAEELAELNDAHATSH